MPRPLRIPVWWREILRSGFDIDTENKKTLRDIAHSVRQLSRHLNDVRGREEENTKPYLAAAGMLQAYLCYYTTANMLKLHAPLGDIARSGAFDVSRPLSIVDLGCGPGTGVAGLAAYFAAAYPDIEIHYLGVDSVPAALHAVTRMAQAVSAHVPGMTAATQRSDINKLRETAIAPDIVLIMNALNEFPQPPAFLLRRLEPMVADGGWAILIEPALRATSRRLLEFRDHAVREGWSVYSPCFRQSDCPALVNEQDWCHHDAPWERPAFIAQLDAMLGHVKLSLKFSYIVLNRRGSNLRQFIDIEHPRRVVSELALEKGRSWCFVCNEEGRFRCRQNTRDITPSNEEFVNLSRYDTVGIDGAEPSGNELRITPTTRVRL